jgi:hypothetical protein
MRISALFLFAAVLAVLPAPFALAGGEDEDSLKDAAKGPTYFGFVRDKRGSAVSDVSVVLKPKDGEATVIKSNILGFYRTHVPWEIKPDDVSVSCEKSGYRQLTVSRRKPQTEDAPSIETSCVLERL